MARKSNTKEIKNKHSSRPVGGVETGSQGGEDSHCRGGTETGGVWDEWDRQSDHRQTLQPHIRAQINRTNGGEWSRPHNTRKPLIENARGGWGSSRRDSQPHRRGCWTDPQGPMACTSPPTREPALERPSLIVGGGVKDWNPVEWSGCHCSLSAPPPCTASQYSDQPLPCPREHLRLCPFK